MMPKVIPSSDAALSTTLFCSITRCQTLTGSRSTRHTNSHQCCHPHGMALTCKDCFRTSGTHGDC